MSPGTTWICPALNVDQFVSGRNNLLVNAGGAV